MPDFGPSTVENACTASHHTDMGREDCGNQSMDQFTFCARARLLFHTRKSVRRHCPYERDKAEYRGNTRFSICKEADALFPIRKLYPDIVTVDMESCHYPTAITE